MTLIMASLLTLAPAWAFTQPVQVIDLHTGAGPEASGDPGPAVQLGSLSLFTADDVVHGRELWRSDGTATGTVMVKDIHPGAQGSGHYELVVLGDRACFIADDGGHGRELWCSDGTEAGTQLVADIRPGRYGQLTNVLRVVGNTLYFAADDGIHGSELWRSDGTAAGTMMVADIRPGPAGSNPAEIRELAAGVVLFRATRDDVGSELFRSNGNAGGTVLVRDVRPGTESGYSPLNATSTVHNGVYYFVGNDLSGGAELYRSDGTSAGTYRVMDIRPGIGGASIGSLHSTPVGLLFMADAGEGSRLWRSHGTEPTTINLGVAMSFLPTTSLAVLNGAVLFASNNSTLWRTDGSAPGTAQLSETVVAEQLTPFNGLVYFRSVHATNGSELFRSDGTAAGTMLAANINPGPASSSPSNLRVTGNRLLFSAKRAQFGRELWQLMAGQAQPIQLANIAEDGGSSAPRLLGRLGNQIVFSAFRDDVGRELWSSDGSAAGTALLADIEPGAPSGMVMNDDDHLEPVVHQNHLYFVGTDNIAGAELWRTDGTPGGTHRVTDIGTGSVPGLGQERYSPYLRAAGSYVYFGATHSYVGSDTRLWRTDGTTGGTVRVHPGLRLDDYTFSPRPSAALGSTLLFSGGNSLSDLQLYRTDGTEASTTLVRTINPNGGAFPGWFTTVGNQVYFTAYTNSLGRELYRSNGTFSGTSLVKDIRVGALSAIPMHLTGHEGALYFSAIGDDGGRELWRSDGSSAGTQRLADIHPGLIGSVPSALHSTARGLFFSARHPDHGVELWRTDGTATGTVRLTDAAAGLDDGLPDTLWNETLEPPQIQFDPILSYLNRRERVPFLPADDYRERAALYRDATEFETLDDDRVVFRACSRQHGCQLWISDGSRMGTYRLTDMGPAPGGASPGHLTAIGQTVYFAATDELGERELWSMQMPPADDVVFRDDLEP